MNVLFHHFPLCGGRGVMTWLQKQVPTYWQKLKSQGSLEGARVIGGHKVSEEHVEAAGWDDCYACTVLRDPEERMVSLYAWKARQQCPGRALAPLPPFARWLQAQPPNPMLLFLQMCVSGTHVYRFEDLSTLVAGLGKALRIPTAGYRPFGVTGAGSRASEGQKALVRRFHALDCKFWADLTLRRPPEKNPRTT